MELTTAGRVVSGHLAEVRMVLDCISDRQPTMFSKPVRRLDVPGTSSQPYWLLLFN
jgi:hypothetical protein